MDKPDINKFLTLPDDGKIQALIRLSYKLTMIARGTYVPGTLQLSHPMRLRTINEIQHRILAHVLALLKDDLNRYPAMVLLQIILDPGDDPELQREIDFVFSQIIE